jgi:hypothetical protein
MLCGARCFFVNRKNEARRFGGSEPGTVGRRTVGNGALPPLCARRWDFLNEFPLRMTGRRRAGEAKAWSSVGDGGAAEGEIDRVLVCFQQFENFAAW